MFSPLFRAEISKVSEEFDTFYVRTYNVLRATFLIIISTRLYSQRKYWTRAPQESRGTFDTDCDLGGCSGFICVHFSTTYSTRCRRIIGWLADSSASRDRSAVRSELFKRQNSPHVQKKKQTNKQSNKRK